LTVDGAQGELESFVTLVLLQSFIVIPLRYPSVYKHTLESCSYSLPHVVFKVSGVQHLDFIKVNSAKLSPNRSFHKSINFL
jgi:hypothetical protein